VVKNRRLLILAGLIALALYIWLAIPTTKWPIRPISAGWDDLIFCLDLVSFDGAKTLSITEDGTATIEQKSRPGSSTKVVGTWQLSGQPNRYILKFNEKENSYERIAPSGADMCMLVAGNADIADLRQSWFAIRSDDGPLEDDTR
jgi:hypothetical protein